MLCLIGSWIVIFRNILRRNFRTIELMWMNEWIFVSCIFTSTFSELLFQGVEQKTKVKESKNSLANQLLKSLHKFSSFFQILSLLLSQELETNQIIECFPHLLFQNEKSSYSNRTYLFLVDNVYSGNQTSSDIFFQIPSSLPSSTRIISFDLMQP